MFIKMYYTAKQKFFVIHQVLIKKSESVDGFNQNCTTRMSIHAAHTTCRESIWRKTYTYEAEFKATYNKTTRTELSLYTSKDVKVELFKSKWP